MWLLLSLSSYSKTILHALAINLIVGQVGIKTGGKESNLLYRMSQSRWKDQFCEQNKLAKSANIVSKFKAKHAIIEQSQCLKSKVGEGFRFIDSIFFD